MTAGRWRAAGWGAGLALLAAACTGSSQANPDPTSTTAASTAAAVEEQVVAAAAAATGAPLDRRDSLPPPQIDELDVAAGRATVTDCTVNDGTLTGVTSLLRRGDDDGWQVTRSEPRGACLPQGLQAAVEGWWTARADWLADPDPTHPLLDQHLTGAALEDTRRLLDDWADRGWVGHTPGVVNTPWVVRPEERHIVVEACGPGGSRAAGQVGIEDTLTGEWPTELIAMEGEAERAVLTMRWEAGRWRIAAVEPVGIAPAPRQACARLCPDDTGEWCLADSPADR